MQFKMKLIGELTIKVPCTVYALVEAKDQKTACLAIDAFFIDEIEGTSTKLLEADLEEAKTVAAEIFSDIKQNPITLSLDNHRVGGFEVFYKKFI